MDTRRSRARVAVLTSLAAVAVSACAATQPPVVAIERVPSPARDLDRNQTVETPVVVRDPTDPFNAERDDVNCTQFELGADAVYSFATARFVVDGELGALCLGTDDQRLVDAWEDLAAFVPATQLSDLGVFSAFESTESDGVTLAFVSALDSDGTLFQMSLNLDEHERDTDEALLTLAHEFSHVFTSIPSQIDRSAEAEDGCDTYFNGEGCFFADSLMYQWIEEFWGDGLIDEIDPYGEVTTEAGEERCAADSGFFGPYAASNPEEDFAEAFSVYVFDAGADSPGQQARLDWFDEQPGLVEFRDRARAAGFTDVESSFGPCG